MIGRCSPRQIAVIPLPGRMDHIEMPPSPEDSRGIAKWSRYYFGHSTPFEIVSYSYTVRVGRATVGSGGVTRPETQ
jgi:hypothetical protein